MKRKIIAAGLLVGVIALGGCATGSSVHTSIDKEFQFADVQRIVPGMKESEVVNILGRPNAFGADEKGNRYLLYLITKFSGTTGMVILPAAGGSITSVTSKGFELRIQIRNDAVDRVAYKVYTAT